MKIRPTPGRSATTSIPSRASSAAGPMPGEHQQLRRLEDAGAEDDLLSARIARSADVGADAAAILKDEPADAQPVRTVRLGASATGQMNATVCCGGLVLDLELASPTPSWVGPL